MPLVPERRHGHVAAPDRRRIGRIDRRADLRHARRPHRAQPAHQPLGDAQIVGEAHRHPDPRAFVGLGQGVGVRRRPRNLRGVRPVDPDPLEGVAHLAQPVRIGDRIRIGAQRLADPARPRNLRRARGRRIRLAQVQCARQLVRPVEPGGPPVGGKAGDRTGIPRLGEGIGLAAGMQHQGRGIRVVQRAVQLQFQVARRKQAPHRVIAAVDGKGRVRQRAAGGDAGPLMLGAPGIAVPDRRASERYLLDRHRSGPDPRPSRAREIGQHRADILRSRRPDGQDRALQRLRDAQVVLEDHLHPDPHAKVRRSQRVGLRVRARDRRRLRAVDADPAEGEARIVEPVMVGDLERIGAQRLAHARRARNTRHARRRAVERPHVRALRRFGKAHVVLEAHPHLDPPADVFARDRVGARIRADPGLVRAVHPEPAVAVLRRIQPVGIRDPARVRAQRLAGSRLPGHVVARDRRGARRRAVLADEAVDGDAG